MKTILYKEIDGKKIVRGIGNLTIDGIETQQKIKPLIEDTAEFKAVKNKKDEIGNRAELMAQGKAEYRKNYAITQSKTTLENKKEAALKAMDQAKIDYTVHSEMISELQNDLGPLVENLKKKGVGIFNENRIFFKPAKNEKEIDSQQAGSISDQLKNLVKGELLTDSGNVIIDNRGKEYWSKPGSSWESALITKLTDEKPSGGELFSELNDTQKAEIINQKQIERIAGLTSAEKIAEKDMLIDGAASEADAMRGKLEIQGETDALAQAQSWYNEKVAEIVGKYS